MLSFIIVVQINKKITFRKKTLWKKLKNDILPNFFERKCSESFSHLYLWLKWKNIWEILLYAIIQWSGMENDLQKKTLWKKLKNDILPNFFKRKC